jgi:hypothetical protein
MGAKPKITENLGYRRDSMNVKQVKIATSNLFIDTTQPNYDNMISSTFDGIGGIEFINSGEYSISLRDGNSLVGNADIIRESVSSSVNEKQADGFQAIASQYELKLSDYIPPDNIGKVYLGNTTYAYAQEVYSLKQIPNVYFDTKVKNVYVSATGSMGFISTYGTSGYGRTATITFPTNDSNKNASDYFNPGDIVSATYSPTGGYAFAGQPLTTGNVLVTNVVKKTTSPYNVELTVVAFNQYSGSPQTMMIANSTPGALVDIYRTAAPYSHINIDLDNIDDEEIEVQFITYSDFVSDII